MAAGIAKLLVNGEQVGEGKIANHGGYYLETLDVGEDLGTPVNNAYASPFAFTGTIVAIRIDLR
jgi:arylsulfatase